MGVLYIVVPLDDSITGYLRDVGVEYPAEHIPARNPTPRELREATATLTDQKVTVHSPPEHAWQIMIEGRNDPENEPWTLLNVTAFNGDEATPHAICFEKGWPSLILRVVHILSARCGPLVIVPDTGCTPIVVGAADDPQKLFEIWDHARGVDR
jgi:hypothetical protein